MNAPRSIDEYLKQLRAALAGQDPALIQDALYDAEEYLRAEVAAHPDKSEADVLELIASTYGAPEEVASAYKDTEAKVKAALKTPAPASSAAQASAWRRFFGVFLDFRAYSSLFYMLLTLATGIVYFTVVVTGLSLSFGLGILIIGIPFFLAFIGITRVISLGEGRLLEAVTGERMPRRPVHPGPPAGWLTRIAEMLKDARTWTTLLYMVLMLPLGIVYFTTAVTGITLSLACMVAPVAIALREVGIINDGGIYWDDQLFFPPIIALPFTFLVGVFLLFGMLHLARGIGKFQGAIAKHLLVKSSG